MRLASARFTALALLAAAIAPALANERQNDERLDSRARATGRVLDRMERRAQGLDGAYESDGSQVAPLQVSAHAALSSPPCSSSRTTTSFAGTTGTIANATPFGPTTTFTLSVAGAGPYLWDVNLFTAIQHLFPDDLDMSLTSPAGTVVVIQTDNAVSIAQAFNGTVWDDNVNDPVTDHVYTNLVTATSLSPEGRLQSFRGENPNGTWTLTFFDDFTPDSGNLTGWSLDIRTLAAAPTASTTSFPKVSGLAIGPGVLTTTDTVVVAGVGTFLMETELITTITHTANSDLDMTLASPLGPAVKFSTDNGGTLDNGFNGSLFDVDAPVPVTDAIYANLVAETPNSPEGAFDNWLGQDPNGVWTLTVVDDLAANGGTLVDWTVSVTTIPAPTPSAPVNYPGTGGPIADNVASSLPATTLYTNTVSGVGTWLWDVDLTTELQHTWSDDLDLTLISPTGTQVVVSTRNGGNGLVSGFHNVFNGTLWDDNANDPATDHVYSNLTVATPLSPEGRLAAFRGENPNGVWTLKVVDNDQPDPGTNSLNSWSLAVSTLSGPLAETIHAPVSQSPGLAISSSGTPTVSDVMAVAGVGSELTEVALRLVLTHTNAADLEVSLTSPLGTVVKVTTDNGGTNDNVYNGSLFDPGLAGVTAPVSDALYVNNVPETPISPEGSFDNFAGQNPNGSWTLTVFDDATGNGGTLVSWQLEFRTCGNPAPVAYCFGDGSGTSCPCVPVPLVGDPDKGCPNGPFPGGGKLTASGTSSISNDSLVMTCTTINNGGAVVFQGTNNNGGGLGTPFGDGLRCAAGTVRRMKSHPVTTNSHQYPDPMFGDNSISQRGAVLLPGDRWYQGWYRSGLAHCDPTQNYNLTNGVKVTWVP